MFASFDNYTAKRQITEGLFDNWREYLFYKKTRHQFCQRTYLSLFGVVNIQRYGNTCDNSTQDWQEIFISPQTDYCRTDFIRDGHHWFYGSNFCWDGKFLRAVDYGSLRTQKLIEKFGDIFLTIDPSGKLSKEELK